MDLTATQLLVFHPSLLRLWHNQMVEEHWADDFWILMFFVYPLY